MQGDSAPQYFPNFWRPKFFCLHWRSQKILLQHQRRVSNDVSEAPTTMEANNKKRKLLKPHTGRVSKKARNLSKAGAGGKKKKQVDVNSLKWRTVDVPEMFDDAEGFYGLEEIDGVEIVRNGNTVQFVRYRRRHGLLT